MKKMIYVASPYAGDVEKNVEFAKAACDYVRRCGFGFFAPHLFYPEFLDDNVPEQRKQGLEMGLSMLTRCDELWIFGNHISSGMRMELEYASKKGVPIRQITTEEVRMTEKERQNLLLTPGHNRLSEMCQC